MKKCMIVLAGFILLLAGCPRIEGGGKPSSTVTEYKVTFSHTPDEGGSLTAKRKDSGASVASGSNVPENTIIEFTATPKNGYRVKEWTGATANPKDSTKTTLKVTTDANVKVFFVKNSTEPSEPPASEKYTVTYSHTPADGGSLIAKIKDGEDFTSESKVPANTVLEFTAIPKSGYKVEKWEGVAANPKDSTKTTLKVTTDANVKVFFVKNSTEPSEPPASEKYTVTYSHIPSEGGSLTAKRKDSGDSVASGSEVSANTVLEFTAAPNDGYKVEKWEVDGLTVSAGKKTATLTVQKNVTVRVTFTVAQKHTITFSAEPLVGGTVTAKRKDNGVSVTSGSQIYEGTEIIFTAVPTPADVDNEKYGFYVKSWEGEGLTLSDDKKTAELTVKKDTEVKVQFLEYFVQNVNWDAAGSLKDESGNWKKFHLIIHDSNTLTVFESSSGIVASKIARIEYDSGTKTLSFVQDQGGTGSIKFTSIPQSPLPADCKIELENVKVRDLELPNQTATINVTFNKDNFIH